jgi:sugar porter (SP) family MFS transporter
MSSHSPAHSLADEKDDLKPQVQHDNSATLVTAKVENAAFAAAKQTAPKLNPWNKEGITILVAGFVSYMCAIANGYDGSLMGAILAMPYFATAFPGAAGLNVGTGVVFSIYTIGQIVGGMISGQISDKYGRRFGMFAGCLILVVGSIIIASSNAVSQFIAGRFFLGLGIAIAVTCAPTYCVEIAPPQWRGRMTGFYNTGWFGGSIPAAAITLGTQYIQSNWSWRIPLICQCVPAGVVCLVVFLLPESPRWLFLRGREEEARNFLVKYHGANDPNSPWVTLQWQEFREGIDLNGTDKRWYDYSGLFISNNARWRSLMVILMGVFGQFSGNGLGYFNPQIFKLLGYDTTMQFVLNLAITLVSATGAYTGVAFTDKMPRRKVLWIGTLVCAVMLAINAGLQVKLAGNLGDVSLAQGALTAYFLFNLVYSFTYTPLQALYPVECLQTNARAKGMGAYQSIVNVISFINTFAGPIALGNIKYNYIFVFVGWDCVESLLWYLLAVETQGRTLEELDEIFSARNPVAASKAKRTIAIKESGDVVVVNDA